MSAERKLVVSSSFSRRGPHRASPAKSVLFSRRQKASLSTKGGKTEPRRRPCWASKGNTNASSIESRPLLSSNFCDDSLFLSLSLSQRSALSQSRRRRWKETTTTLLLFFFLCVAVVALSTKSKANNNNNTENREKESNAFWRLLLRLFFLSLFFVCLLSKCLGYYIEKKRTLCWIFALFEVHLLSETLFLKVKIDTYYYSCFTWSKIHSHILYVIFGTG